MVEVIILSRDASYTTQPLELLNAFGYENPQTHTMVTGDVELTSGGTPKLVDSEPLDNRHSLGTRTVDTAKNHNNPVAMTDQEMGLRTDSEAEGLSSDDFNNCLQV